MRILYLDIDTLRPDHLGCYGYARNTSPNIDRIAAEGVRLTGCYTSDAPCLPSRSALMTGRFGIHNGEVNHGGCNAEFRREGAERQAQSRLSSDTLPAWLNRDCGLHTVYIGGFAERHSAFDYYAGFREIYDSGKCGLESAEDITPQALAWIDRNASRDNWYLHLNYWDPHTPYRAPTEFGNPFNGAPMPAWLTEEVVQCKIREEIGPHGILDLNLYNDQIDPRYPRQPGKIETMADVRRVIDGYDCGINYLDRHLGQLIDALVDRGVWDDLTVIVSSDHGENLGELGMWSEHGTADQYTCRIPLIIRKPGAIKAGTTWNGLQYHLDLLPTLAELLDVPPRASWEGESFAPALRGREIAGRDQLILSQCTHGCQRAVRWENYIYIRTYHDFFHLFDREMLFDLAADPFEQHNLAPERQDLCYKAAAGYLDWLDSMMATQPDGVFHDPLWEVLAEGGPYLARGRLAQYCRRLEESNRGWAVPLLLARHSSTKR